MRKIAFLLPLCILLLAGCTETKYNTLTVPKVTGFKLQPNGDLVFNGSGMEAMKTLDVTFEISLADHEYLGKSLLVFSGKSVDIQSDSQFIIHASDVEKAQFTPAEIATLSKEVQTYIQTASAGKEQTQLNVTDNGQNKQLLIHLGTTDEDYALWLTLKDTGKKFWKPGQQMETTFKFGFYQFSAVREGNFSEYNPPVLEWDKL